MCHNANMIKAYTLQNAKDKAREILDQEGHKILAATIHPAEHHWNFHTFTEKQQIELQGKYCVCLELDKNHLNDMHLYIHRGFFVTNTPQLFFVERLS